MKLIQENQSPLLVLFIFKLILIFLSPNATALTGETRQSASHSTPSELQLQLEFEKLEKLALNIKKKDTDPKETMKKILLVLDKQKKSLLDENSQRSLRIVSELTEQLKIAYLSIKLNKKVNIDSCYKSTKYILRSLTVALRLISSFNGEKEPSTTTLQQAFLLIHIRASPAPEVIKYFAKTQNQSDSSPESPILWERNIPSNNNLSGDIVNSIKTLIFPSDSTSIKAHGGKTLLTQLVDTLVTFHEIYSQQKDTPDCYRMLYQAALLIMTTENAHKPNRHKLKHITADQSAVSRILSSLDFKDGHTDHLQPEEMTVLLHSCEEVVSANSDYTSFPLLHMVSIFIAKRLLHKIIHLFSNETALASILTSTYRAHGDFTVDSLENRLERIKSLIGLTMSSYITSSTMTLSQVDEGCSEKIQHILQLLLYIYHESSELKTLSQEVNAEEAIEQIKSLSLTAEPLASFTRDGISLDKSSNSELVLNTLQDNLTEFHEHLTLIKGKVSNVKEVALPNFIKKLSSPDREQGEKTLDPCMVRLILGSLKNPQFPSGNYSETLNLLVANLVQDSVAEPSVELIERLKSFSTKEGNTACRAIGKSYHKVAGFFGKLKELIFSSSDSTPPMDIIANGSSLTTEHINAIENMCTGLTDPWDDKHLSKNSTFAPQEPIASPNTLTKPEDIKTAQELLVVALRKTELEYPDLSHAPKVSHFFKMIYQAFIEAQDNPVAMTDADLSEHQQSITTLSGILKYMAISLSDQPCETCNAMKDSLHQLLDCSHATCSASTFMLHLKKKVEQKQKTFIEHLDQQFDSSVSCDAGFDESSGASLQLQTIASAFIDNLSSLLITPAIGKNDLHLDMLLYCTFLPSSKPYTHNKLWKKAKSLCLIHRKINGQFFSRAYQALSEKNNPILGLLYRTVSTQDRFIENIKQLTDLSHPSYSASNFVELAAKLPSFGQSILPIGTQQKVRVYQRQQNVAPKEKMTKKVAEIQWDEISQAETAPTIFDSSIQESSLSTDTFSVENEVGSLSSPKLSKQIPTHSASEDLKYFSEPSVSSEVSEEQKKEKDDSAENDTLSDNETLNLLSGKDQSIENMTNEIIAQFNSDNEYRKKVCMIAIDLFQPFTAESNELKQVVNKIRGWLLTGVGKIGKQTSTILAVIVSSAVMISNSSSWFGLMKKFAKKFIDISALTSFINEHGPNATLLVRSQNGSLFQYPETSSLLKSSKGISSELRNVQYFQGPNGEDIRRTPGATDSGFLTFNVVTTIALSLFNVYGVYKSVHPQQERLAVFNQSEYLALLTGKLPTAYLAKYLKEREVTSKQTPNSLYKVRDTLENPCNSCGSEASLCSTCLWQTLTNCISVQCCLQTSKTLLPTPCYSYEAISTAARNGIVAAAAGVMSKNLVFDMLKLVLNARIKDMLTQFLTGVMLNVDYSFSATQKSSMANNFMTAAEHYQVNTALKNLEHRILNPDNLVPFTETDKQILKYILTPEAYDDYVTHQDATTPVPCCNPGCRMAACGTCLQGTSCICAGATCALFSVIPFLAAGCDTMCGLSQQAFAAAKDAAHRSMKYYSVDQFPNNIVSPSINKAMADFTQVAKEADKLIHVVSDGGKQNGLTKAITMALSKGSQSLGQIAQITAYLDQLGWKQQHKAYILIALIIGGKDCLTGNFARWSHLQGDDLLRTVSDVIDQLDTPVTNVGEGHARETDNITQPYGLVNMGEYLEKQAMNQHWQSDDTSIMKGKIAFEEKMASFLSFGIDGIDMMTQPFHKYQEARMQEFCGKAHADAMRPPVSQTLHRQAAAPKQPDKKPYDHYAEQGDYQKLLEYLDEKPETDTNVEEIIGQMLHQANKVVFTKQLTDSQKVFAIQCIALEVNKQKATDVLIKRLTGGHFYQKICEFKGFSVPTIQQQPASLH